MQVCPGIKMMGGVGYDSNIYLIDGEVLVDTGTGAFFPEMKESIENSEIKERNIKTIILTHCHYDHTGAAKKFRDWIRAHIGAHENDVNSLKTGEGTMAELFEEKARTLTIDSPLKENDAIKTSKHNFKVLSTPGHTPGSICLYDEKKRILISGDTVFQDGVGRTDFDGGSLSDLKKSLKKITKLKIDYLLPGHGMPKIGGAGFLIKQIVNKFEETEFP